MAAGGIILSVDSLLEKPAGLSKTLGDRTAGKPKARPRPSASNRTLSQPNHTTSVHQSTSFAKPSSTCRKTSEENGRRHLSSLGTAGSLLAGAGSRPSTPEENTSPKSDGYAWHAKQDQSTSRPALAKQYQAASERSLQTTPSAGEATATEMRESVRERLSRTRVLQHNDELFMHGRAYIGPLQPAKVTWKSDKPPRKDHDAPAWLTATEFEDTQDVTRAKCRQLAELMRLSKKTVLYTGAGISASVIGQAALSGQNKVGWKPEKMKAKPTFTHHALGFLGRQGCIHSWIQQNHDGLPQKAGFPQECINEIHGSWYDPSNPVVKYSGTLHSRSFPWMEHDAETADLVLVLGTSLGGLNADQVATNAAERSLNSASSPTGSLGTVCINLQQTAEDGKMSLRLFGKSDDVLPILLEELGFEPLRPGLAHWPRESRALVPYDRDGRRVRKGAPQMWLDLSDGARVRITPGHNIQGAGQPQFMHIGAKKLTEHEESTRTKLGKTMKPGPGLGCVKMRDEEVKAFILDIEGAQMRLGLWWLDAAVRGAVEVLPVVNVDPLFGESPAVQPSSQSRRSSANKY